MNRETKKKVTYTIVEAFTLEKKKKRTDN
jgi:hypothetical protein